MKRDFPSLWVKNEGREGRNETEFDNAKSCIVDDHVSSTQ